MAKRRRSLATLLGSAKLAIGLMIYLGIIVFIGTLVPQGDLSNAQVAAWVASNPQWEVWAQRLGLHAVYTSWYFLIGAALLAVSTTICSWRRTKVALARFGALRRVSSGSAGIPGRADYSIPLTGGHVTGNTDTLACVESALANVGVRGSRRGDTFVAASSPWSVWGSPIFHWSLVLIFCTLAVGALFRAEGLMGVAEGEGVKDEAAAYRVLTVGPLHRWPTPGRTIFLNKLYLDYAVGGMDRGTSPEVSVLDASGAVVARQVVYPNNALHLGSLTIHNSKWGLASKFELLDKSGAAKGASSVILDFPSEPSGSTEPGEIELTGAEGQTALVVRATMPLDRDVTAAEAVPRDPKVDVELLTPEGKAVGGGRLTVGEKLALPDGSSLRLARVGYYARLSVVDDPTIPLLYASLIAALASVTFALLARQRLVVVAVSQSEADPQLDILIRLWRNAGVTADEIRGALALVAPTENEERANS